MGESGACVKVGASVIEERDRMSQIDPNAVAGIAAAELIKSAVKYFMPPPSDKHRPIGPLQ